MRYAEDLSEGEQFQLGRYELDEDEMVGFAERYDPVPIHVDREGAASGPFGGLIASGLLTMAVYQRLVVEAVWHHVAGIAGRSFDIRLIRPVRAGTTLTGTTVIESITLRAERHDAVVLMKTDLVDAATGQSVLAIGLDVLVRSRPVHDEARPRG